MYSHINSIFTIYLLYKYYSRYVLLTILLNTKDALSGSHPIHFVKDLTFIHFYLFILFFSSCKTVEPRDLFVALFHSLSRSLCVFPVFCSGCCCCCCFAFISSFVLVIWCCFLVKQRESEGGMICAQEVCYIYI